ncbi:MAG: hypothetical protein IPJ79_08220 [Bacteroidetes bacterium]|nr:hypothetical protein [Bacteroidota bacterium]
MKKIKIILNAVVLVAIAHIADAQQLDSTYTYSYNCQGCGTFTTVTTAPVDVETSVSITNETLTDTSQSTLASFVLSAARKKKTVNVTSANRFNVYPTPAKDKYFLNFETEKKKK